MGRGRAKAKQAKVARRLKYQTGDTSIEELREELGAAPTPTVRARDAEALDDLYADPDDDADDVADDEAEDEVYGDLPDSGVDGRVRDLNGGDGEEADQSRRG